jgi:hypothetical protein
VFCYIMHMLDHAYQYVYWFLSRHIYTSTGNTRACATG